MLLSVSATAALGKPTEHFLEYSEDNFKVQFISGNLTASVTRDWPRVDFQHSANLLAPMFEIGMNRMFLFNDTNGDGVFSRSETTYTILMESGYVHWNMTGIEFSESVHGDETASFVMSTTVSLYRGYVNQTVESPDVPGWANVTFEFSISEIPVVRANSRGQYTVEGKTDMEIQMNIKLLRHVNASGLALEQALQAGGSVYLFELTERDKDPSETSVKTVSARVDERGEGLNFAHRFEQTSRSTQHIDFSREDGRAQAHYDYSSEPTTAVGDTKEPVALNCSYYTTGTSLVLLPSYTLGNQTDNIAHDMSIGLDMGGFVRVRDWAAKNLPLLAVITGGLVVLGVASVHLWRRKRRMSSENGHDSGTESENRRGPM